MCFSFLDSSVLFSAEEYIFFFNKKHGISSLDIHEVTRDGT